MWWQIGLFTLVVALFSVQQVKYWRKKGYSREGWVFLLWMGLAWGTGVLFLSGFQLPSPVTPIIQGW